MIKKFSHFFKSKQRLNFNAETKVKSEDLRNKLLLIEAKETMYNIQNICADILDANKSIAHKTPDLYYEVCNLRYDHEELIKKMRNSRDKNARRFARLIYSDLLENIASFEEATVEELVIISNVIVGNKKAFLRFAKDLKNLSWHILFFGVDF